MAALCALPALVQSAHADEAASFAGLKKLVDESLDIYQQFFDIGELLMSNDIPIADAATKIDALATRLAEVSQEIEDMVQACSPADQAAYEKLFNSDEHFNRIQKDDDELEMLIKDLEGVDYYENEALKAACERFCSAFPRG